MGFPLGVSSYLSLNHADLPTASGLWSRAGWSVRQRLWVEKVARFTAAGKVKWTQQERKRESGLSVGGRCWKREAVKVGREHILEQVDGPPFQKN